MAVVAGAVAPDPLAAVGLVIVLAAAFFARASLERRVVGLTLRQRDPVALALLGALAVGGTWLAGRVHPELAGAGLLAAAGMVLAALWARRERLHRSAMFEGIALAGLGASSALAALAGGAPLRTAAVLGLVLGVHAGLSVPLIRGALRKGRRGTRPRAPALLAILAATVAACIVVEATLAALALTPRVVQVARLPHAPATAGVAGLIESAALAVVVTVLALGVTA